METKVPDLLVLRALLGFERWQYANKGLPLGSVKDHLGSIGGVEASRIEDPLGSITAHVVKQVKELVVSVYANKGDIFEASDHGKLRVHTFLNNKSTLLKLRPPTESAKL